MTLLSTTLLLVLVMDPVGNVPAFLAVLRRVEPQRQRRVVLRELSIALFVLVFFLFAGRFLLGLLHIAEPSLTVAGGIILFLIALRMIFPGRLGSSEGDVEGEPFIVPLAVPFVAGPSTMASVMLIMSREPGRWPEWLLALVLAWLATSVSLLAANSLKRYLGERGLIAMERLMGMLLSTLAVQMFLDGVSAYLGR